MNEIESAINAEKYGAMYDVKIFILDKLQQLETLDDETFLHLHKQIHDFLLSVNFLGQDDQDDCEFIPKCLRFLWDQYQEILDGDGPTISARPVVEMDEQGRPSMCMHFPSTRQQLAREISTATITSLYESLALEERWEEMKVVQKYLHLGFLGSSMLNAVSLKTIEKLIDQYPSALFENHGEAIFELRTLMHRSEDDGSGMGVIEGSYMIKKALKKYPLILVHKDKKGRTLFHRSMGAFSGSGDVSDRLMVMKMFFCGYNNKDNETNTFMKYLTVAAAQVERAYSDLGNLFVDKGLVDRSMFDDLIRSCVPNPLLIQNDQNGSTPIHDLIQSSVATFSGTSTGGQYKKHIDDETLKSLITKSVHVGGQPLLHIKDDRGCNLYYKAVECKLSSELIEILKPMEEDKFDQQ